MSEGLHSRLPTSPFISEACLQLLDDVGPVWPQKASLALVWICRVFIQAVVCLRKCSVSGSQVPAEAVREFFSANMSFSNWAYLLPPFCLAVPE